MTLKHRPPLDPRPEEFLGLFRVFLSSKGECKNILALSDITRWEAFTEIIDRVRFSFSGPCSFIISLAVKAFQAVRLDTEPHGLAVGVLREDQTPSRFLPVIRQVQYLRVSRRSGNPQGRKPSYTFSYAPCRISVKELPCGKTCPTFQYPQFHRRS